jgi:hypothetical protein
MPNWCNNVVEISHNDKEIMERVKTAFNDGRLLDEFVPVPKELNITAGRLGDIEEQKALELQEKANEAKYGYKNWYDYCVNEWGTKWDVSPYEPITADIENNQLILSFDSAWSPPIVAYEKLIEMGFSIRAYYYEPGMAFAGVWEDGDDDFYEYGGYDSTQVAEELPEALDDMFGISQSMAEYEEQEAQEIDDASWRA